MGALRQLDEELAAGAPGKAERVAAVEAAENAKQAAEAAQAELVQQMTAAKEAKDAAVEAAKSAKQSLADFMPDLKSVGDELDEAKAELDDFVTGALASFNDLKEWKEGDFDVPVVASPSPAAEDASGGEANEEPDAKRARVEASEA